MQARERERERDAVATDMVSRNPISLLALCRFIDLGMSSQKHHGFLIPSFFIWTCNLAKMETLSTHFSTAAHFLYTVIVNIVFVKYNALNTGVEFFRPI